MSRAGALAKPGEMLEAALEAARRGLAVFPLHHPRQRYNDQMEPYMACSCANAACTSIGKHPRFVKWAAAATTDERTIRRWWGTYPHANVGVATGEGSHCWVLDVDDRNGGGDTLAELEQRHGPLPETVESITGGGGRHIFFEYAPGIKNSVGSEKKLPGLDTRNGGGLIVAPGSYHASGRRYEWEASSHPDEVEIARAPEWLLALLREPAGEGRSGGAAPVEERIPEGRRNATLTSLAGTMRRPGLTAPEIEAALLVANARRCVPPLPAEEVRRIAASVGRYEPVSTWAVAGTAEAPEGRDLAAERFHLSDYGNAERLVARHGEDLRYCHTWGRWLVWDGHRFAFDDNGAVVRLMKATIRAAYADAGGMDSDERKAFLKHLAASESAERINAAITLARSELGIAVRPDQFDADPWLLNVQNGTIDLRTSELRPHCREDLLTKVGRASYRPDATCPVFDAFLRRVLPEAAVRDFAQRFAGYSATGTTGEEALAMSHGAGRNGKSKLMGALSYPLGDYAAATRPETFMAKRGDGIPNDIAALVGSRMVATAETEDGRRLDVALIKQLTGNDMITARFMRAEFFSFRPTFKVWFSVNHRPVIRDTTDSIWARVKIIPFEVTITEGERDTRLGEKLEREADGILRWIVEGCRAWQEQGLAAPRAVRAATEAYRQDMDQVGQFIDARCDLGPDLRELATPLYHAYQGWCGESGEKPVTQTAFGLRLGERGLQSHRGGGGRYSWLGIGLREPRGGWPAGASDGVTGSDPLSGLNGLAVPHEGINPKNTSLPVTPSPSTVEDPYPPEWEASIPPSREVL